MKKSVEKTNEQKVKQITRKYKDDLKGLSNVLRKFDYSIITEWLNNDCNGNFDLIDMVRGDKGYYFASFCLKQLKFNGFTFKEKLISESRFYEFLTTVFLLPENESTIKYYSRYDADTKKGIWEQGIQIGKVNLLELWEQVQAAEEAARIERIKAEEAAKAEAKAEAEAAEVK